ncbi:hypothetical protein Y032_0094g2726 [Ancylostoma ceylanicum]|uniref:non-specific serine/threonine protein kinase n=2 Tax=Ancylostoma ceylanicum TaxID=53326 RepID=A0A016TK45_9BILA|nr:hypothetical protein Y032_0094g2726 [Ancylostoma ceylanicum]
MHRIPVTRTTRSSGRVYPPGFPVMRPHQISAKKTPLRTHLSPMYRFSKTRTYMEQCFEVVKVLGNGSFGQVLDVKCLETGKRFAIKKALRTFESSGKRRRQLMEVINHESIAPHPNIVRFEKAWEERGRLYIQTELCGPNLHHYRAEFGPLSEEELWTVLVDTLKALEHLHSEKMLHLDVKPSNIFISVDNTMCKLGDFGLAVNLNMTSADSAEDGDRNYMAPELLNEPPTSAADMYSLGITMLELATNVDVEADRTVIREGCLPESWFEGTSRTIREKFTPLLNSDPTSRPRAAELLEEVKLLGFNRAIFKRMRSTRSPSDKDYIMDKDWDFESEDAVHPPSLRAKRKYDKTFVTPPLRKRLVFDDEEDELPAEKPDVNTTPQPPSAFTRVLEFNGQPPLKKAKVIKASPA